MTAKQLKSRKIAIVIVFAVIIFVQLACAGGVGDKGMAGAYLNTTLKNRVAACDFSSKAQLTSLANDAIGVWDGTADEWLDGQKATFSCIDAVVAGN